jgi:hypothetical protein
MTLHRMDNVGIVVDDHEAAIAFSYNSAWSWRARRRAKA